jgi:hypothetical protein
MFWKNKKKKITDVHGSLPKGFDKRGKQVKSLSDIHGGALPKGFDKRGKQVKPLSEVNESEMDNPFEEAHRKAQEDVKNHPLKENLYEHRTLLLSMCDLVTELQLRLEKDPENFDLQERLMEARINVKNGIRTHENYLEEYIDMNLPVFIKMIKKTIGLAEKEMEKWND